MQILSNLVVVKPKKSCSKRLYWTLNGLNLKNTVTKIICVQENMLK